MGARHRFRHRYRTDGHLTGTSVTALIGCGSGGVNPACDAACGLCKGREKHRRLFFHGAWLSADFRPFDLGWAGMVERLGHGGKCLEVWYFSVLTVRVIAKHNRELKMIENFQSQSNSQQKPVQALPIFVLTLSSATARRAPLIARLQALGLDHELFFGVDGTRGLPPEYEPMIDRSARVEIRRRPMTDGEYACTLSHLFIHRLIVERGLPEAIILEDDARIGADFAAVARGRIRPPGDLVMLDFKKGFYHWRGRVPLGGGLAAYRVAVAPVLATGYLMRQKAARHFVENGFPVRERADWPCDITTLQSYVVHPRLVAQPPSAKGTSHLDAARSDVRSRHRAGMAAGVARVFSAAFWRRRVQDWYALRYRRLDNTARPDISGGV